MVIAAEEEAAHQFDGPLDDHRVQLLLVGLLQIGLPVGLEELVQPAQGEAHARALQVQTVVQDPDGVHRLVQGLRGVLGYALTDLGQASQLPLAADVGLFLSQGGGHLRQLLRVSRDALQAQHHGLEGDALEAGDVVLLGELIVYLLEDAGGAQPEQPGVVGDGVRDAELFPGEEGGEALIDLLAQGVAVVLAHHLPEVPLGPVGEHLQVEDIDVLLGDVVGVGLPVRQQVQLPPDGGPQGVGVEQDAHAVIGGGACEEIVFGDNGLPLFQQVLECVGLAQLGYPGAVLAVGFEAVVLEPVGEQLGALHTDLRGRVGLDLQQLLQPREVLDAVLGEIGILEVLDAGILVVGRQPVFFAPGHLLA